MSSAPCNPWLFGRVRLPRCRFWRREEPRPDHLVTRGEPQRRAGRRLHVGRGGVSGGGARCSVQVSETTEVRRLLFDQYGGGCHLKAHPAEKNSLQGHRSLSLSSSLCGYRRRPITVKGEPDPEAATKKQKYSKRTALLFPAWSQTSLSCMPPLFSRCERIRSPGSSRTHRVWRPRPAEGIDLFRGLPCGGCIGSWTLLLVCEALLQ